MEETFTYDDMNRLTGITLKRTSGQYLTCAVTYDALGRMTSRQAVAAVNLVPQVTQVLSQPVFDATKVHALASATTSSGVFPPTPQNITYTGFDKVSKVKQGTDSICYTYGFNQQRIYMEEHAGTNYWRTFVTGPYGVFAVVESRNGTDQFHYVLKDNLGSWTTITNATGTVEQQLSYDAWGNLRNPITWANYRAGDTYDGPMFDRGYTGHEHAEAFGLINMNGRMYDPVMGGFLSVDRFVQNPLTAQGFNRYSYCMNNPLRFIDPTGWLPGGGGGNGEHPPGAPYYVDGMLTVNLPEVTIMPFNEESFEYTPNLNGGGGPPQWNNVYGGSSNGSSGCGGGSGNHGGRSNQKVLGETPPVGAIIHTGNGLFLKAYWHYQFGKKEDFWVDASTLKLDYITQKDLYYHDGIATVNLFDHSITAQSALTLGKIDLTPVGENLFEIQYDTYNFEIEWEYGWTTRNIGTAISGFIHGPVLDDVSLPTHWMDGKPCYAQPSVYWGGPFKIHFTNCVYIKP